MKRILSLVVLIMGISFSYAQSISTKEVSVEGYDKVYVRNACNVKVIARNKEGVDIRCDKRLLPAIEVERKGSSLYLGLDWDKIKKITGKRNIQNISVGKNSVKVNGIVFEGGIDISVYVREISAIGVSTSGEVSWRDKLPTDHLLLEASSSGRIAWEGVLELDDLQVEGSSSGAIEGDMKVANQLILNMSSSSNFEGKILANDVDVHLSSSADIEAAISAKDAHFQLSSSSDMQGSIDANTADFRLSTSADAELTGTVHELTVNASSSSNFRGDEIDYHSAEVKANTSADIYLNRKGHVMDKSHQRNGVHFIDN